MKELRMRIDDQLHGSVKQRAVALGLSVKEYAIGALTLRLRMDAENKTAQLNAGSVENSTLLSTSTENNKEKETKEEKKQKKKEELKEKTKEIHITRARAENYFQYFWEAYPSNCPRRVNKKKCRDKFLRIFKPVENNSEKMYELFIDMMVGLEFWKESEQWMKDGGEYIKAPLVWLNNENWNETPLSQEDAMKNKRATAKASCEPTKPRPASTSDGERKKPSWMTWEQWQFEEAERMQNQRMREKVESVNEALEKVRKEFGI